MAFNPPEKSLDLPSPLVKQSDGERVHISAISQVTVLLTTGRIKINYQAQARRHFVLTHTN